MSVNYNATTLNNRLQQVVNAIDGGGSNGFMRLLGSGGNVLSSFQLSRPMGVITNDVLIFNGLSLIDPAAAASGTATAARVEDSNGGVVISGLVVNGPSADILLSPTAAIIAGQAVAITQATITGN